MKKLWAGRTSGATDKTADDFQSSISFDARMYRQDLTGSMAHAAMLAATGIISAEEAKTITLGLEGILADLESGALTPDPAAEDIHMFVEEVLTERIGTVGKKLHTARSRNDQVTLDLKLYLRDTLCGIREQLRALLGTLSDLGEEYAATIMPGYTHLQRAQPVTFGHHMMAYAMMFLRDDSRLSDCLARMDESPIGCCALAGTTFPTDRQLEAEILSFSRVTKNSLDGVSDRDYCLEALSCLSLIMMHLSRLSEELVLWSSWEFGFVTLSDAYTTGSSIMPQKKNSDMAELIRGKCGRVYGDLMALLTTMKGLPLAYNKDMQEDKESIFDALDTVVNCLSVMTPMLATMTVHEETMHRAAETGFINATDLADYLTARGMPFRDAYRAVGELVRTCIAEGKTLTDLPLGAYRAVSPLFESDLYDAITLEACVARRTSEGGTSPASVLSQAAYVREKIGQTTGNEK
ncbi:MAG: argininosuccinate lyase [Eubacteriales bacterium]